MALRLKALLRQCGATQIDVANHVRVGKNTVSAATISLIINHGRWPRSMPREEIEPQIIDFLIARGAPEMAIATAFEEEVGERRSSAARRPVDKQATHQQEEDPMLLRKQTLHPAARKHFGLFRDPFTDDVSEPGDVFVTPDIRYVREAMYQTAKHGGFLAIAGESGAGKTTLRRDLADRIIRETLPCVMIEPYVLGMEDNDKKGRTLKASSIADAIIAAVAPLETPRSSQDAKFRQLHRALRDSRRAGYSHVVIIEEAHSLPVPTIKHLKRFFELEDGFKKLLSIILIGQPELKLKLSERNHEVREVVQRCEVVELAPLDGQLNDYIKFKLERIGKSMMDVFADGALDALAGKMSFSRGKERLSLLYPLAVNNLTTAAMNLAAHLGAPRVTADIVKEA